jgi:ribosomal protein S27E
MSWIQNLLTSILPRRWAEEMEAESRTWMLRCKDCDSERSVWEAGGVRWKAAGRPSRLVHCPRCGRITWHTVYRPQAGSRAD